MKSLIKGLAVLRCLDIGQALKNNGLTVERFAARISARRNKLLR